MGDILLQLKKIHVHYGGVKALDGVDLDIGRGEIVALMGPNGAGKSTILKTIFGIVKSDSGSIIFEGEKISPISHEMAKKGVSFVAQGKKVFESLTVKENLLMGGIAEGNKNNVKARIEEMEEIFPVLRRKANIKAGKLSGGEQQIVAIARGLIMKPRLLLLDEPSLGLAPKILKELFKKIQEINKLEKTTIIIVEHNIKSILEIAHSAFVLDKGKIVAKGNARDIEKSDVLENVFLGKIIN
ncbi:MAG: ABC transporter ATP-binding protein [Candidatus Moraniibacteriota bacterium]